MGFVNSLKFTMGRRILSTGIRTFPIALTAILTANKLLSRAAEKTDFLDGLLFTVHRRMDVQPQRRCDIGVTQHFAQTFYIDALFDTPRCVGMSKRVIAALSDTAPA